MCVRSEGEGERGKLTAATSDNLLSAVHTNPSGGRLRLWTQILTSLSLSRSLFTDIYHYLHSFHSLSRFSHILSHIFSSFFSSLISHSLSLSGPQNCVVCYFGDGAASEGDFHAGVCVCSCVCMDVGVWMPFTLSLSFSPTHRDECSKHAVVSCHFLLPK